ncbi:MAG: efflux RND transporter periplasmic adaptor subunit [Bacteroidales bacterium]|nr:efflux RND transporter periplasmic adaptor subunit [Bacteroidales bacterium]
MKKYINVVIWCVIGLFVLYTFYYLYRQAQPKQRVYEVLVPEVRDIVKTSVASGKVEPRDEVNIKPQIQGIITELYVEAGNKVKQDDPIAKVAVIPDMSQLNSAQSNVRTAQLTLEETQREHARLETLHEKGLVSHEEFEKSKNALDKAVEARHAAQDQLDIVTNGISKRSGKINTTIVRSTISGTILEVPVKIGTSVINANSFNEGTTVATVADMGNIIFRGNIDETEVGRLSQGMHIDLTIGAIQGVTLPATLEYISPKGMESNGAILFEIKAAAQIPDTLVVRAGYSANAKIEFEHRSQVLSIQETAIEFEGDSTYVYRLTSSEKATPQKFERIPVSVGLSDGLYIEVKDGVTSDMKLRGNEINEEEK